MEQHQLRLPQALLAVISDAEFTDSDVLERRRRDHERIDGILVSRVGAENDKNSPRSRPSSFSTASCARSTSSAASASCVRRDAECGTTRSSCRHARLAGPDQYAVRLGELEVLSAARIADLVAPGQVMLRLAVAGFGVTLPPEALRVDWG